jgi:hypothetical protein
MHATDSARVSQSVSQVLYWRKADVRRQWHWKLDNMKKFINVIQFLCVKHISPNKIPYQLTELMAQ